MVVIEVSCRAVWKTISEYVDGELEPELRRRLGEHFKSCRHCTALLNGTQNVVSLAADDRVFELPRGFGERLLERIRSEFGIAT